MERKFCAVCSGGKDRSPLVADYLRDIALDRGYENYIFESCGIRNHGHEIRKKWERGYEIISISRQVTMELLEEDIYPDYRLAEDFGINVTFPYLDEDRVIDDLEGFFELALEAYEESQFF